MGIPIKEKPCKGLGITKDLGCGKITSHRKLGLGLMCGCYSDFILKTEPGKLIMQRAIGKGKSNNQKIVVKNNREEIKQQKENLKTISAFRNDLQKEINSIVRLIDNGHACIATNKFFGKMNAGHYISVGSNGTIRYHLENIWLQSEHSNNWKAGDTIRYQKGIRKLFGRDYLEYLDSLQSIAPIKLTIPEIKEKISICRGIIKWLKLQDRIFSTEERLSLRLRFNKEIGIYDPT